jgi:thiosulfate/3-mercaptopyruvate sulfurtransferase
MWERWKQGWTLHEIGKLFDRHHGSVRQILAETGGIRPAKLPSTAILFIPKNNNPQACVAPARWPICWPRSGLMRPPDMRHTDRRTKRQGRIDNRSTMTYTTLISVEQLQSLQASGTPLMVFDCSFDLTNPTAGSAMYAQAHIPGAVYAHLDTALSAKADPTAASGGRHPLPARETFATWLGSMGFANGMQAVVYDRQGVNYAGRLWWMLKWLGHEAVAVLDGGLQAWQAAGHAVQTETPATRSATTFAVGTPLATLVTVDTVLQRLGKDQHIVDARALPRFKGEVEPLDPVAGHIPGALNRPFVSNIGADGKFKPAAQLRQEFEALLGARNPAQVVHHCGSGVSAIPNVLAMEIAGLGRPALFAGSWSEWCSDASRPVAQG